MKTEQEIWKPIPEYEYTEVSNFGRIRNQHGIRKLCYHKGKGYACVVLSYKGKQKFIWVHRLVALLFVPNPDPEHFTVVMHLDDNPRNNRWDNLSWGTAQRNNTEGRRIGVYMKSREKTSMPTLLKNLRKISGTSEWEGHCIMYDSLNDAYAVSTKDKSSLLYIMVSDFQNGEEVNFAGIWSEVKNRLQPMS